MVVPLALALVPVWLMRDALLGLGALYQRDVHLYWHHQAEAFVRAVAAGSWPVWDRTVGFGQPLLANSSAQVLYPLTWLNLLMRPWWYYTVFAVVHLVLSAAGMYRAARALACSRLGALAAAVLWTASGPFVSYVILWHHFSGAAWLPWILAGALTLGRSPTPRAVLAFGGVFAMAILAGSFEMVAMGAATTAAALGWTLRHARAPWPEVRAVLVRAAAAGALALGLSAAQWMPTVEVALRSGRRELPRETRTYWSLNPIVAGDLLLPGFAAEVTTSSALRKTVYEGREPFLPSLYLGLSAAGLVVAGCVGHRGRGSGMLAAAGVAALIFAFGRYTPVYDVLMALAPPLKAFRYPVKVMVLVALCWSLLAGMGVDYLRRADIKMRVVRRVRLAAAATPVLAASVAAALYADGAARGGRDVALAAVIAAAGAACAVAALRGGRWRNALAAIAAVIAAAEVTLYNRSLVEVAPIELYAHRPEVLAFLDPAPDARLYCYDYSVGFFDPSDTRDPAVHRLARLPAGWGFEHAKALAEQMSLTPVVSSRWGRLSGFDVDYTGLASVPMQQIAYLLRAMEGTTGHIRMLQLGGIDYVVARHPAPLEGLLPRAEVPGLFEAPIRVSSVPDPMPAAYVVPRTRAAEGLSGLSVLLDPAFDFRRQALVPGIAPPASAGRLGTARIVEARPDRLRVEVDSPDGGYLVVLESYDPGWRAAIDGSAAPVVPANILFRGVAVTAGRHVVEMTYRPASVVAGVIVSALCLLFGAAAWAGAVRQPGPVST